MTTRQRPQRLGLPWVWLCSQHLTDERNRRTVIARHARDERIVGLGDGLRPVERRTVRCHGRLLEVRWRIGDEVQHGGISLTYCAMASSTPSNSG